MASKFQLLTEPKAQPKGVKGEKEGYLTFILHLAPATLSGYQVCPQSTPGCRAACLNTAGRGGMFKAGEFTNMIQRARIRKTKLFFEDRQTFMMILYEDIMRAVRMGIKENMEVVVRLNGTSDIAWEKITFMLGSYKCPNMMAAYPTIQFYDYTKITNRLMKRMPSNYHLTFSKAESNDADVEKVLMFTNTSVAVVFSTKALPKTYLGVEVFNGDETDLRFLDPKNSVIGLYAKGKAKKDKTGFVVQVA